jgi:hypothetical protein
VRLVEQHRVLPIQPRPARGEGAPEKRLGVAQTRVRQPGQRD